MSTLLQSTTTQRVLIALGALVVLCGTFALGVHIGERRAGYASGWERGYRHMMPIGRGFDRRESNVQPMMPPLFPNGHGVFGNVLSVSNDSLVIQGKDGIEQTVLVTTSTTIRVGTETVGIKDIPKDLTKLQASAFGTPNASGQVEARLIRLFTQQ
jgi:hypothetical protein